MPTTDTETDTDTTTTMQAITQDRYGAADVLELGTRPRPVPAADEVLVRVRAAGLDRGAWHLMLGHPYLIRVMGFGLRRPKNPVLGREVAGVVEAVGASVTRFRPGDEVFGIGEGTFAEYVAAKETTLAPKPARLSFEEAAALPISGLTALQALRDVGRLEAGQRVLVIGASGGVGSFAVQIAKARGAEVTGVASTAKLDLVRSLGADHVVDYTRAGIADRGERYDLILDIGGNRSLRELRRALTERGTLVIVGGENAGRLTGGTHRQLLAMLLSPFLRQRLTTFISKEKADDLDALADLVDDGAVTPSVGGTYPLPATADALRDLDAGRAQGKLVIVP